MNPRLQRHLLLWVGCLAGRLQILSLLELLLRDAPFSPFLFRSRLQPPQRALFAWKKGKRPTRVILGWDKDLGVRTEVEEEEARRRWWLRWLSEPGSLGVVAWGRAPGRGPWTPHISEVSLGWGGRGSTCPLSQLVYNQGGKGGSLETGKKEAKDSWRGA